MENFVLNKYLGRWYEIAKKPFPMERDCNFATADYSWNSKTERLIIKNTCLDQNRRFKRESLGQARLVAPGELKVKFSGPDAWPEEGDYIVLYTDYTQYAIVGGGPFLWILARTPTIPKEDVLMLLAKVKSFGYNPDQVLSNKKLLY